MKDEQIEQASAVGAGHEDAANGVEPEVDVLDVEASSRLERKPVAKRYQIRIDRERYVVESPVVTGRELLGLAGKTPVERFMIFQVFSGGRSEEVGLGQPVDLRVPGIEKFRTLSRDQTEG
jgi:hypothetical protein